MGNRLASFGLFVVLIIAVVGAGIIADAFMTSSGLRARYEAERAQAKTQELQARRELLATWPLVFASLKDSVLVIVFIIVDNILLIVLVADAIKARREAVTDEK